MGDTEGNENWIWEESDRDFGDLDAKLRSMGEDEDEAEVGGTGSGNDENNVSGEDLRIDAVTEDEGRNAINNEGEGAEEAPKVGEEVADGNMMKESECGSNEATERPDMKDRSSNSSDDGMKMDEESTKSTSEPPAEGHEESGGGPGLGVVEGRERPTDGGVWSTDPTSSVNQGNEHLNAATRANELGGDGIYGEGNLENNLGRGGFGNNLAALDRLSSPSSVPMAIANQADLLQESMGSINPSANANIANTSAQLLLQQQNLITQLQRMIAQQQAQLSMTAQNPAFPMTSQMSQMRQAHGLQDPQLGYLNDPTSFMSHQSKPADSGWLSQSSASLLYPHDRSSSTSLGVSQTRTSTSRNDMDLLESSSFASSQFGTSSHRHLPASSDRNFSLPDSDSSVPSPPLQSLIQSSDGSVPMTPTTSSWAKSANQSDNLGLSSSDAIGSMGLDSLQSRRSQQTPDPDPLRSTIYQAMQQTSSPGHLSQMTSDLISLQLLQMQQQQDQQHQQQDPQQMHAPQNPIEPNPLDTFSNHSPLSHLDHHGLEELKGLAVDGLRDQLQDDFGLLRSRQQDQLLMEKPAADAATTHRGKRRRSGDGSFLPTTDNADLTSASQLSDQLQQRSSLQDFGTQSAQEPIQISFFEGLPGGWQSDNDLPERRRMLYRVTKLIERMRPNRGDSSENLKNVSKKIEERLYRSALTQAEYLDISTLKQRLQNIALNLGVTNAANTTTGMTQNSMANNFGEIDGMARFKSESASLENGASLDPPNEPQHDLDVSQDVIKENFLDGHFTGAWQSNADLPDRRKIVFTIAKVIGRMRPNPGEECDKLPVMAKKLEELLYRAAPTKREYTDLSTLKDRLQKIAQVLGVDQRITSPAM